ncbi:MAG: hypothetical protein ACJ764_09840 [Solirubrobacteraceae bacterium]
MSFFDEVEEPLAEPSSQARPRRPAAGRGRRTPGGGGGAGGPRGPGGRSEQAVRTRRLVALAALIVVLILIVIGVHSCQVSQANSDLRNYTVNVSSLIQSSNQTSHQFFGLLSSGQGPSNSSNLQSQVDEARLTAETQLNKAKGLDAPGQLQTAQADLVRAMQMRADGIADIAQHLPAALQPQTSASAVEMIGADMARFYASDVLYKDYTLPMLVKALHDAGIPAGGPNGEPINEGQFLPDVQWLLPTFIASELKAPAPGTKSGKVAPGTHGHQLSSVSVGSTTLQTGSTNTVPAQPAPTFTLSFSNSGSNDETGVVCKVTVGGSGISGQSVVPRTAAGQSYTCKVTLSSSPPPGAYTVTATVEAVPGEKNASNNTQSFPVTFQ